MIEIAGVTHYYELRPAILDLNFRIREGEIVCLMGPNGVGKSTLLRILAGVLSPLEGTVAIGGKVRRGSVAEEREIRKMVAYLPDRPWLPGARSPREFLFAVGGSTTYLPAGSASTLRASSRSSSSTGRGIRRSSCFRPARRRRSRWPRSSSRRRPSCSSMSLSRAGSTPLAS